MGLSRSAPASMQAVLLILLREFRRRWHQVLSSVSSCVSLSLSL